MRRKRSRLSEYQIRPRQIQKDKEGVPVETYGDAFPVQAEIWPAGGKVQAEVYGERLAYIANCRIEGSYTVKRQGKEIIYQYGGQGLKEMDGICVNVSKEEKPDYRIVAIKPYRPLYLELERML